MLRTHKDVFSEYLSDAFRWSGPMGQPRMEDWREWLDRHGLERCAMSGLYGEYGYEVIFLGDYDEPVRTDGLYPARYLASMKGFKVVEGKESGSDVLRLVVEDERASSITDVGEVHLSFSDGLFASKEKRIETYLDGKEDLK